MGISFREKIKQLPIEQQQEIEERSKQLIAEETKRQQLRQLLKITQEQNGQFLQTGLDNACKGQKYANVVSLNKDTSANLTPRPLFLHGNCVPATLYCTTNLVTYI